MAKDKNRDPEDGANTPSSGSGDPTPDNSASVEGPDIETGFSDEDLAFLAAAVSNDPQANQPLSGDSLSNGSGETDQSDATAEILGDLKRVQAEFANDRKRIERDREATRELNIAEVVKGLLPVLDDLSLAEAHGDLAEGPMVVIVQKLRGSLEKFGLTSVGEKGDVFDPHLHEALVQLPTPGVTINTIADVVAPGYMLGERLLRPAKVAVAVPAE